MSKITTKKIIPLLFIAVGLVFAIVGFTHLGFWDTVEGPMPGFFPSIMAIVMIFSGIIAFIQSFKEDGNVEYKAPEFLVISAGIGIFVATFIIGLIPTIIVYIILWLKLFEKSSWKNTLIILAITLFITIGVFGTWLGIQFPKGILENIL
ncbi:tripartite tricarboxylate transporter TctB family protein [Defluviitalea phaphyphila]|uniref:tripartite tricarboxylate transporter TctB family protein n=1 Tax=Defluviitalea phaphyphila TaxID=1473580 RepID=UPI0007304A0F|nr:tripartite tricarboxylate transporter TctB family protein [Defluviitalea phaphyphila]